MSRSLELRWNSYLGALSFVGLHSHFNASQNLPNNSLKLISAQQRKYRLYQTGYPPHFEFEPEETDVVVVIGGDVTLLVATVVLAIVVLVLVIKFEVVGMLELGITLEVELKPVPANEFTILFLSVTH